MLHVICFGNLWQGDDGFGIHGSGSLANCAASEGVRCGIAGALRSVTSRVAARR